MTKDIEYFDKNKTGELMSRVTSDTERIHSALSENLSSI